MSQILLEDMEQIASDNKIQWQKLRSRSVLITGATGTIGAAIVRALFAANHKYGLDIRILALGRDKQRAEPLIHMYGAKFFEQDIRLPILIANDVDYVIHCAAVTRSSEMAANPVGVSETSLKGTENALSFAKEKRVKSMVYLSSMEVYGITDQSIPNITEDILGYIDINNPRSCYPESKRMCENLCHSYFVQYGVPVKTARLAQTFGAGTPQDDPRVFAQFARSAMSGEDIVLHTEGKSFGNYCYISDAVRGILLLLLKGKNGEAYNIANSSASMTIREMAELVAHSVGKRSSAVIVNIPVDIKNRGYAPDAYAKLSAEKMAGLGWRPAYGLAEMYSRMVADWSYQRGLTQR